MEGEFEPLKFENAWRRLVERHGALRTSLWWERQREPLQVVHREVPVKIEQRDWRGKSEEEVSEAFAGYLEDERRRGLELKEKSPEAYEAVKPHLGRMQVRIGGFDTSLRTCEDWDLWQRATRMGGRWLHVDPPAEPGAKDARRTLKRRRRPVP